MFGVATPFMAMVILDDVIGIILLKLYAAKWMVVKLELPSATNTKEEMPVRN